MDKTCKPKSPDFYDHVFTNPRVCNCRRFMVNAHAGNRADAFFKIEQETEDRINRSHAEMIARYGYEPEDVVFKDEEELED